MLDTKLFDTAGRRPKPDAYPALLLNADYAPISTYPLKTLSWRDALSAVMANRMDVVEEHDYEVYSAKGKGWRLPSVVALRRYQSQNRAVSFTRMGIYVRDRFTCAYCGNKFSMRSLTFDHVVPSSKGGKTNWMNIVTACHSCNLKKGDKTPEEAKMPLRFRPYTPTRARLNDIAKDFPPPLRRVHRSWLPYLGLEAGDHELTATEILSRGGAAFPAGMTDDDYWNAELEQE
jgi:5-methylcytosine-specific restriction endonuclease McrA